MVVGDDAQSIYGFRHADIRNILDFERDFPDAEVVKLEQNYRSTQTILSAANAVIERNRERRPKKLWTEIEGGEPVQLAELGRRARGGALGRGRDRAARRGGGRRARRGRGLLPDQRDEPGAGGHAASASTLPYQVIGGTKFYERAEIKDAVAYLSLLANPADQVSFARVVNSPRRGIGNTSQGRLASHANTTGLPIWEVTERAEEVPGLERRRDQGGLPLPRDDGGACATRAERGAGRPTLLEAVAARDAATWKRSRRSARSRPRAGSRTSRS